MVATRNNHKLPQCHNPTCCNFITKTKDRGLGLCRACRWAYDKGYKRGYKIGEKKSEKQKKNIQSN